MKKFILTIVLSFFVSAIAVAGDQVMKNDNPNASEMEGKHMKNSNQNSSRFDTVVEKTNKPYTAIKYQK
ncbi:hypothetical protein AU255_12040 [Methyloprofundus sedimenti]|uniref:Uncharacterized protein n=1 Tax=Methyloprofundus sedimenti TaxID=1420851 RepID=A0A1V8MAE3_9GAMM|nr:hypothetical protein [Methyloprofundus sedimenti]OQK18506.1 hypothetical protein AU255_12040 [Methyloprofundus sedimenti]